MPVSTTGQNKTTSTIRSKLYDSVEILTMTVYRVQELRFKTRDREKKNKDRFFTLIV